MKNILNQYSLQWKSKNIIFHGAQRPLVQQHVHPQLLRQEKKKKREKEDNSYHIPSAALSLILETVLSHRTDSKTELKFPQPKENFKCPSHDSLGH